MTISPKWKWILLSAFVLVAAYYWGIRELVIQAYMGNAPSWFISLIDIFYPRFFVEKHRFDLAFFLQKADLVVWRSCLVISLLLLFGNRWYRLIFKDQTISHVNYHLFRWVLYLSAPLYYWDWFIELIRLGELKEVYQPILLLAPIFPHFPSSAILAILFFGMGIANILVLANWHVRSAGLAFAVIFIVLEGLFLSFHKIDHGFATYIYCLLIFPWMAQKGSSPIPAWPLQLIWVSITLSYFLSGMEKLTISGWHWVSPENLKSYLLVNHTDFGIWVAQSDGLCLTIACLGIVFQLGFLSVVFYPKLLWIFIPAGITFHFMTGILFQITGLLSPWQVVYIFFIDWEKIWARFWTQGFRKRRMKTKNG